MHKETLGRNNILTGFYVPHGFFQGFLPTLISVDCYSIADYFCVLDLSSFLDSSSFLDLSSILDGSSIGHYCYFQEVS
ncbi:hypothetical protein JW968_01935 [Candidatus Woesearchaeota archaeon]|nr:hypothetical protein [Candidatus Woesearchaeota archaeon]